MFCTKYKSSGPCSFRREDFLNCVLKTYCLTQYLLMQPTGTVLKNWLNDHQNDRSHEVILNWPQRNNFNNFGRGSLDGVTCIYVYYIQKLWACGFRHYDFFLIAFWKHIVWPRDLLMQPSDHVVHHVKLFINNKERCHTISRHIYQPNDVVRKEFNVWWTEKTESVTCSWDRKFNIGLLLFRIN